MIILQHIHYYEYIYTIIYTIYCRFTYIMTCAIYRFTYCIWVGSFQSWNSHHSHHFVTPSEKLGFGKSWVYIQYLAFISHSQIVKHSSAENTCRQIGWNIFFLSSYPYGHPFEAKVFIPYHIHSKQRFPRLLTNSKHVNAIFPLTTY